jgi:hypothetical protein
MRLNVHFAEQCAIFTYSKGVEALRRGKPVMEAKKGRISALCEN